MILRQKFKRTKFELIDMTNKKQIKSNQKFDYIISKRS